MGVKFERMAPVAEPGSEQKIREMEDKLFAMPGSRVFVSLAEEYRRAGRFEDALGTLLTGLASHPSYLSAQIAIARLYQEMGRPGDAIEAFSKVIASDRENLVAAKALAELHLGKGDRIEAVKKFKLYRALSGEHSLDERIAGLEREIRGETPPVPETAQSAARAALAPAARVETMESLTLEPFEPPEEPTEIIQTIPVRTEFSSPAGTVPFPEAGHAPEPPSAPEPDASLDPTLVLRRDRPADAPEPEAGPPEAEEPAEIEPGVETVVLKNLPPGVAEIRGEAEEPARPPMPEVPVSRTLADLYFSQGHYADARAIFERLAAERPGDPEIESRLSEIAARLSLARPGAPSGETPASRLRSWLSRVQRARGRAAEDAPRGFRPILEAVGRSAEGVLGSSLIGRDGLAVESAGASDGSLEAAAAEMTGFLQTVASAEYGSGVAERPVKMVQVNAVKARAILTAVTDEYYLLMLVAADGNAGRARYEGRKAAARLEKELS